MPRKRILLFTELPVFAAGLQAVLSPDSEVELVTCGRPVSELPSEIELVNPDALMVEWGSPMDWPLLSALCRTMGPRPVLLLVRRASAELLGQAREAGVAAVLDLHAGEEEIAGSIRRVLLGEILYTESAEEARHQTRQVRLTPREGELVSLLVQGLKNKEIAACLDISEGTVKVYLSKLFQKVGAKDRFELALFGLKNFSKAEMDFFEDLPPRKPVRPLGAARSHRLRTLVVRLPPSEPAWVLYRAASAR